MRGVEKDRPVSRFLHECSSVLLSAMIHLHRPQCHTSFIFIGIKPPGDNASRSGSARALAGRLEEVVIVGRAISMVGCVVLHCRDLLV